MQHFHLLRCELCSLTNIAHSHYSIVYTGIRYSLSFIHSLKTRPQLLFPSPPSPWPQLTCLGTQKPDKMKSRWFLVPAVVSCLDLDPLESGSKPFIDLCSNLTLTKNTGLLSGSCGSEKAAFANTYVDLNECLAWGPKEEGKSLNELHPAEA